MARPPLNALRSFEAVARLGGFGAAAKALFVTQSAVSHQVRQLEDWLGLPLFDRRGGRPRLLPRGEELARSLTASLSEIEAACERARDRAQPLVVAAIPSVAVCWLIPRLGAFRAAHPDVQIRVVYAIHGHEVDFQGVHLAFTFAAVPPALPGVRAEPFLPGRSVPVCAPMLLERLGGARPDPGAMLAAGLLHDAGTADWGAWLDRAGAAAPDVLEGPVFEDFNLLRAAALSGQGVALCPGAMIRDDIDQGRLVALSDVAALEDHGYYLLHSEAAEASVGGWARAFRDWAFAARDLSGAPGGGPPAAPPA